MKILASIAMISVLTACGPAPEIKTRAPLFKTTENLVVISEKADKDLITTKFKDSILLKCDFFIDNRPDFDLTQAAPGSFSGFTVNIAKGESPLNLLSSMNNGQKFTTGVRVRNLDIFPELRIQGENGITHIMKSTPLVEITVRGRDVHGNSDKRYEKVITLNEKNPVIILDLYPKKYPHILKCELQTKIAEGFEADYTEEAPVVAEPAVSETEASPDATEIIQ